MVHRGSHSAHSACLPLFSSVWHSKYVSGTASLERGCHVSTPEFWDSLKQVLAKGSQGVSRPGARYPIQLGSSSQLHLAGVIVQSCKGNTLYGMKHLQLQALAFSKEMSAVSFLTEKQDCYVHVAVQIGEPANFKSCVCFLKANKQSSLLFTVVFNISLSTCSSHVLARDHIMQKFPILCSAQPSMYIYQA